MNRLVALLALAIPAVVPLPAAAEPLVAVTGPWVRGTVAGQVATGAYMQLRASADATLVGASSPVAAMAEIHETAVDGGVMRMRPVSRLPLPAGKLVELKPGAYHVMLMDLRQPLKDGDTVAVTLRVEARDGSRHSVEISAPVRGLGEASTPAAHRH